MNDPAKRGEPERARRSLRSEVLLRLALLAAAALLLALWIASVIPPLVPSRPQALALLGALVVIDLLLFVAVGNALIGRLVLRPLARAADVADAIAGGDYERRIPPGDTREMATLSDALNRLTEQLLHNQERLEENIRSLHDTNERLHEAQRELVQAEKMASIGRFAAGMAHEIGNPLGAVLGYASVLRRRGAPADLLDGIEREARRIDAIMRGLLDYARPGSTPREPVDVNACIHSVLKLIRQQGQLGSVEVVLDLEPRLPPLGAAVYRVEQMFVNLFSNSMAAMQGVGRLTVVSRRERYQPDRPARIRRADDPPGVDYSHLRRQRHGAARDSRRLEPGSDVVHIVIADTGPGIPREHIDSIFEPFFTTKAPGEGTGLGLAIVASTVAEMGGRIEASSAEGGGATFHLYLPVSEAEA